MNDSTFRAEATKKADSNSGYFGSYINSLSSYVPSSIKSQLGEWTTNSQISPLEVRDKIRWVSFDYLEHEEQKRLVLYIAYNNGFQIWDLEDPAHFVQIVSKKEGPIKCIRLLPSPPAGTELIHHPLSGKRPLLAVVSAETSGTKFPRTMVKLYSLKTHDYVNVLRFKTDVYNIICSKRLFVVVLQSQIYGFDSVTMEKLVIVDTYPSPISSGVVALGPRWLAFPGKHFNNPNAPTSSSVLTSPSTLLTTPIKDVAKDVASGLYYLGDMGRKTVTNYLSGEAPNNNPNEEAAGTVVVYDTLKQKVVSNFRAHWQPLSILAFDPSGTLLVTASADGHNFHVFQITPSATGDVYSSFKHLYKLVRGVTNAVIQNISFSADSHWMAVSSSRGTVHVFGICPSGGPVNIYSHNVVPKSSDKISSREYDEQQDKQHIVLSVLARIKQTTSTEDPSIIPSVASTFVPNGHNPPKLYVVTQVGNLVQYQFQPHAPQNQPDIDPRTLLLDIQSTGEWDVSRKVSWPDYREQVAYEVRGMNSASQKSWLSNVEICTHAPDVRPLWGGPQFMFKALKSGNSGLDSSSVFHRTVSTARPIETRHTEPIFSLTPSPKELGVSNYSMAPSSIPIDIVPVVDDLLKDLSLAMATPISSKSNSTDDKQIGGLLQLASSPSLVPVIPNSLPKKFDVKDQSSSVVSTSSSSSNSTINKEKSNKKENNKSDNELIFDMVQDEDYEPSIQPKSNGKPSTSKKESQIDKQLLVRGSNHNHNHNHNHSQPYSLESSNFDLNVEIASNGVSPREEENDWKQEIDPEEDILGRTTGKANNRNSEPNKTGRRRKNKN